MKNIPWFLLAPVLIGLAGCFLPTAMYRLQGEIYTTRLIDHYSGWAAPIILLMYGVISWLKSARQGKMSSFWEALLGIYITGLALFWLWQTFTLFSEQDSNTLAGKLEAMAYPREGIFLLLLSGCWFLFRSFRKT